MHDVVHKSLRPPKVHINRFGTGFQFSRHVVWVVCSLVDCLCGEVLFLQEYLLRFSVTDIKGILALPVMSGCTFAKVSAPITKFGIAPKKTISYSMYVIPSRPVLVGGAETVFDAGSTFRPAEPKRNRSRH